MLCNYSFSMCWLLGDARRGITSKSKHDPHNAPSAGITPCMPHGTSQANAPFRCPKEHWLRVSRSLFCTSIPRGDLLARDGRHQHPSSSLGSTRRGGSWPTAEFHPWNPNNPWLKGSETPLGQMWGSDLINKGHFLLGSSSSFQLSIINLKDSHL